MIPMSTMLLVLMQRGRIKITLTQFIEKCFSHPRFHCQWIEDRAKQIINHAMVKTIWNILNLEIKKMEEFEMQNLFLFRPYFLECKVFKIGIQVLSCLEHHFLYIFKSWPLAMIPMSTMLLANRQSFNAKRSNQNYLTQFIEHCFSHISKLPRLRLSIMRRKSRKWRNSKCKTYFYLLVKWRETKM